VRRGKRIAFVECTILAGDEPVARAHGTCYVTERKA
jgi:acyl-coenzyme A thioesterase PaaI-like protein